MEWWKDYFEAIVIVTRFKASFIRINRIKEVWKRKVSKFDEDLRRDRG